MNRLYIILALVLLVAIVPVIAGTVLYGFTGFLAGIAISFIILKVVKIGAKRRFSNMMKRSLDRLHAEASKLDGAQVVMVSLENAEPGVLQDFDDVDPQWYERNYVLDVSVTPSHMEEWSLAMLNLSAVFDPDLLDDESSADQAGYGLYIYSISHCKGADVIQMEGGMSAAGNQVIRFHIGAGALVQTIAINAHALKLKEFPLP